ncbi:MAG: GDSL-type esterase/lipase family protein, partial [Planctomycetota bacterium]
MKFPQTHLGTILLLLLASLSSNASAADLDIQKGDHICLVGNALGERMQTQNHWESLLHTRFPNHELVVRNLCFPGDEPYNRIRSKNFGEPTDHLKHSQASVVLYFFGYNESFAGKAGLADFKKNLTKLVAETHAADFGKGRPRIALVSPIAFEGSDDPNLSDGAAQNANLELYSDAMEEVAEATGVVFADVFKPTLALFNSIDKRLTLNGFHLNDDGYRALAPLLDAALFGSELKAGAKAALRAEIEEKNFHWFHRYRAVNGFSIYGDRGLAGNDGTYNNRDVMERERAILDELTANRDKRIWAVAAGKPLPDTVADDAATLPFINPKTNVGIPGDKNAKAGKLGTLEYLPAAEQIKLFDLAEGFEIQLVASEEQFPELSNPVALNFDSQGRLWVATMKSYPHWKPKTPMDDKLLIFEDTDGDHAADVCKVFADNLHQPTGFELGHGGAYVSRQPDIWFMKDTDGDDK